MSRKMRNQEFSYDDEMTPVTKKAKKKKKLKIFKTIRDTGMDLAFIMILASVGVNPILDIIEAKKPSFSINFFYFELAVTSIIIALLPSILFCYYYIWKNPNYTPKKEQLK